MVLVRDATMEDLEGIVAVHRSDVQTWTRLRPDGSEVETPYEELSPVERWRLGGPWLSTETLRPYLHQLLRDGQSALVATDDHARVVGEIEVMTGDEEGLGRCAHVGVLVVLASRQRNGVGRALLEAARERSVEDRCAWLTVRPAADAVEFYRKCGMGEELSRQHDVKVDLSRLPSPTESHVRTPQPLSSFAPLGERALRFGHYQSSFQTWVSGQWKVPGIHDDLLLEEGTIPGLDAYYRICRAKWVPPGAPEGYLNVWMGPGPRPSAAREALLELLARSRELGLPSVGTAVDGPDLPLLEGLTTTEREVFPILGVELHA